MKISTLWYTIRQGVKNIRRNLMFSLASVGTIVACLFLFGIFYAIVLNFQATMKNIESTVEISVFFDEGITQEQIDGIGEQLRYRDEINTIEFISADKAWEEFAVQMYGDLETAKSAFGEDNPLANCASYEITLKDISKQEQLIDFIEDIEGVRKINSSEAAANSLTTLNSVVTYASIAVIVILLLVSIFLISNTITIGITVRKEEIAIMKLIGATDFFVRAPFMVEGVIIGFVGSLVPTVILYFMYEAVVDYIVEKFSILTTIITFVSTKEVFSSLAPIVICIGVGIGLLGSITTTYKHLRV